MSGKSASERVSERVSERASEREGFKRIFRGFQRLLEVVEVYRDFQRFSEGFQRFFRGFSELLSPSQRQISLLEALSSVSPNRVAP